MTLRLCTVVCGMFLAAGLAFGQGDDFNRADGSDMGPKWTEVVPDFRIENNTARSSPGGSTDLMVFNDFYSTEPTVEADVFYMTGNRVTYSALVSRYNNTGDCLFVKVQDNLTAGNYNRVFFYWGNNGGPWAGMSGGNYYVDIDPFKDAHISTVISGNDVTLNIDRDFNGIPEDSITRGNMPPGGEMTGLGGYDNATFDNFAVPEPATLSLLSVGFLALLRRRS